LPPFGGSLNPAEMRDFRKAVCTSGAKQATWQQRLRACRQQCGGDDAFRAE